MTLPATTADPTDAGLAADAALAPDRIVLGDNLALLASLPTGSIDLVYADPPFGTGQRRRLGARNGHPVDGPVFPDPTRGGAAASVAWLRPRLVECHRVLRETGSLFLHVDWRISHRARLLLDELFGEACFRNEIVWHYGLGGRGPANAFARKHDTILFYGRGARSRFHPRRGAVTPAMAAKYAHEDEDGRRYMLSYGRRYYLKGGKPLDSVWAIPSIAPGARERVGYPTQKPEALLERIVLAATDPGDVVLDPFLGSGTTAAVGRRLGRCVLGCDVSEEAIALAAERVRRVVPPGDGARPVVVERLTV